MHIAHTRCVQDMCIKFLQFERNRRGCADYYFELAWHQWMVLYMEDAVLGSVIADLLPHLPREERREARKERRMLFNRCMGSVVDCAWKSGYITTQKFWPPEFGRELGDYVGEYDVLYRRDLCIDISRPRKRVKVACRTGMCRVCHLCVNERENAE